MSWNDGFSIRAFLCLAMTVSAGSTAHAQAKHQPAPIVCPANIAVIETVAPIAGWSALPVEARHKFERISVFNGTPGGQEFDLAPDDQKQKGVRVTQTWDLKAYRSMNIFVRCRYNDTSAVLLQDLPRELTACVLRFGLDSKGNIIGESSMECR